MFEESIFPTDYTEKAHVRDCTPIPNAMRLLLHRSDPAEARIEISFYL
jgi:hypothetical protein